jgi:hypothetical protein
MDTKDLQQDYDALSPKTKASVGRLLAQEGREFDQLLSDMVRETAQELEAVPEFAVWMAEALAWARYARRDPRFFAAAVVFIVQGEAEAIDEALQFSDRFGPEALRAGLLSFRNWFEVMREQLLEMPRPMKDLIRTQERSLSVAQQLREEGRLRGVGMWLLPAPFKILTVAHPELWSSPELERLLMPAGTQVERALRRLHADGVVSLPKELLHKAQDTLVDGATDLFFLQAPQQELARAGGTNLLHINSALYTLGFQDRT